VDPFREPRLFTLDELAQIHERDASRLHDLLLPVQAGLADWAALPLDARGADDVAHGRTLRVNVAPGRYRAQAPGGSLLAIGEVDAAGTFKVLRGFAGM
jgi:tRNA pseudouridine55 synthase